ncbi:hypothetical protein [Intestinibacter bartlettii]
MLGMLLSNFMPDMMINILNIVVGILIIVFGIKLLIKKQ